MHLRISSTPYNGKESQNKKAMMQLLKPTPGNNGEQQVHQNQYYHYQQCFTKGTWTKRIILWTILLIQFGFILCFWLMQLGLSGKLNDSIGSNREFEEYRINFVQSDKFKTANAKTKNDLRAVNFRWPSRDLKFQDEFFLHHNTNNISEAEKIMFGEYSLWCFKEGTINESRHSTNDWDNSNNINEHCDCLPDWHGRDCGQPEVIWRALLTTKTTFQIKDPSREEPHRLVYMLEGTFLNLDLVELQIQSVSKVVDYFILFLKRHQTSSKEIKLLKFRIKQVLPKKNYLLYHCKFASITDCSAAEVYRLFRQQQLLTNAIKSTDIFILTDDKTILGHRALNFIKYYASDRIPIIRFRLKFTVYGFYWQHPIKTYLTGLISSFQNIDNTDANPNLLLTQVTSQQQQQSSLVIGDLNHFGGWFCKYCQEPDEIINELQLTSSLNLSAPFSVSPPPYPIQKKVLFPLNKRHSSHIDVAYIQQLISTGIYLKDGQTQLEKVRRYTDKYYAPHYASEQSWKYGHLLINIYESLEDLLTNENEEEMF